jgi:hypothetical protein
MKIKTHKKYVYMYTYLSSVMLAPTRLAKIPTAKMAGWPPQKISLRLK